MIPSSRRSRRAEAGGTNKPLWSAPEERSGDGSLDSVPAAYPKRCRDPLATAHKRAWDHLRGNVSELDEAWAFALAEAESRARLSGSRDVAAYLALRSSNDLLRRTGIEWLISTVETLAAQANRRGASIQISREDNHRFRAGNSTMVGRLLTLRFGVRQLSVEAGWPRTPRDGVVRGGGLASANIRHLGIKAAGEALRLVQSRQGTPSWVAAEQEEKQYEIHETNLRKHIATLLGSR